MISSSHVSQEGLLAGYTLLRRDPANENGFRWTLPEWGRAGRRYQQHDDPRGNAGRGKPVPRCGRRWCGVSEAITSGNGRRLRSKDLAGGRAGRRQPGGRRSTRSCRSKKRASRCQATAAGPRGLDTDGRLGHAPLGRKRQARSGNAPLGWRLDGRRSIFTV
jgi:hypothetical protein